MLCSAFMILLVLWLTGTVSGEISGLSHIGMLIVAGGMLYFLIRGSRTNKPPAL